jgi:hypothetical protein
MNDTVSYTNGRTVTCVGVVFSRIIYYFGSISAEECGVEQVIDLMICISLYHDH